MGPMTPAPARPDTRPALVAVNPYASRLRDPARRDRILGRVRDAVAERTGQEPEIVAADTHEAMIGRAAAAVDEGAPLVVAVGGDGTVRDLATVLAASDVAMGIIPAGTANLFAATLRIPLNPEQAARALATSRIRRVDLGLARWGAHDGGAHGPRIFVVAAGLGFDARVMAGTSAGSKRRFGRYAYFATALRLVPGVAGSRGRVVTDGEATDVHAIQILVANGGELIPGLLRPARRIVPDDGRLDVLVVEGSGIVHAAHGATEAIMRRGTGRSASGRSRRLLARVVRAEGHPTDLVEVDGDVVGTGWLEAECLPRALRVLVPDATRSASAGDQGGRR